MISDALEEKIDTHVPSQIFELVERNIEKILAQVEPHGSETVDWQLVKKEDGIMVSKKEEGGTSFFSARVEGRIKAQPKAIIDFVTDGSRRHEYDPTTVEFKIVKQLTKEVNISYLSVAPKSYLTKRDFALLRVKRQLDSGSWVACARSIDSEFVPKEVKGYIRGDLLATGWVVEPIGPDEDESYCTFTISIDPKGWVPAWIVNMFRVSQALNTFKLARSILESEDIPDHH